MSENNQFTFNCKHRIGSNNPAVCLWQSEKMNQIVKTTHIFCKTCPQEVHENGQNNPEFLRKCFNRRYGEEFVKKIHSKYQSNNIKIRIPEQWNHIYNQIKFVLNQGWCEDIGLTGSLIVASIDSHKDYDIVLKINDIENYYKWSISNKLPEYINGKRTDCYFVLEPHFQFFVSLWPNTQTVYINEYFGANIDVEKGLKSVYNNYTYDLINKGFDI